MMKIKSITPKVESQGHLPAPPTGIKQIQCAHDIHLSQQLSVEPGSPNAATSQPFACFHHIHLINRIHIYIVWLIKAVDAGPALKSLWVPVTIKWKSRLCQKGFLSAKHQGDTMASITSFLPEERIQRWQVLPIYIYWVGKSRERTAKQV